MGRVLLYDKKQRKFLMWYSILLLSFSIGIIGILFVESNVIWIVPFGILWGISCHKVYIMYDLELEVKRK